MQRSLPALILATLGTVCILHAPAAEDDWAWDGKESIDAYAKRTGFRAVYARVAHMLGPVRRPPPTPPS
jgi:hypothetical protein